MEEREIIVDFGGRGKPLYFGHGNAFPPLAYKPFLDLLCQHYRVFSFCSVSLRSPRPPSNFSSWDPLIFEVESFLKQMEGEKIIALGHSMGGIINTFVAKKYPELFSSLVLINPLFLKPWQSFFWTWIKRWGLARHFYPMGKRALRRKTHFDSYDEVFGHFRRKDSLSRMSDQAIESYVKAVCFEGSHGSYVLNFSPQWESVIYLSYPNITWRDLKGLPFPVYVLQGKLCGYDSYSKKPPKAIFNGSQITVEKIPESGHLLPMEKPQETADKILSFLENMT